MNGTDFQLDELSEDCRTVLNIYAVREHAQKKAAVENPGWLDRIEDVDGIAPTSLTSIHGMLIARGLLRFQITGRSVGLQYQISPAGKDMLSRVSAASDQDDTVADAIESEFATNSFSSATVPGENADNNATEVQEQHPPRRGAA